jgi:membrane-associated phospholipid phosphatase
MRLLAQFISVIFHPLIIPTLGATFIAYSDPIPFRNNLLFSVLGMVFIGTYLLPLLSILVLIRMGVVSNHHMPNRKERKWPLRLTLIFSGLTFFVLHNLQIHPTLARFMLGVTMSIWAALLISHEFKISLHMTAMGGLVALVFAESILNQLLFFNEIALALLIAGSVGSARLYLKAHHPLEVYSGFLLGFSLILMNLLIF